MHRGHTCCIPHEMCSVSTDSAPEHNDLVRQVRDAIRQLAEAGYVDDSAATVALLTIDIAQRRGADPPRADGGR